MAVPAHAGRGGGFTLLEVLVIVVIIAILASTVVLGGIGAGAEQDLRGAAERLTLRIELARDKALQRNREWGVYVEPDNYWFAEYDDVQGQWVEQQYRPFSHNDIDAAVVRLEVEAEDFAGQLGGEDDLPTIVLFSSGETTPFTIEVIPEFDAAPFVVSTDGLARVTLERAE